MFRTGKARVPYTASWTLSSEPSANTGSHRRAPSPPLYPITIGMFTLTPRMDIFWLLAFVNVVWTPFMRVRRRPSSTSRNGEAHGVRSRDRLRNYATTRRHWSHPPLNHHLVSRLFLSLDPTLQGLTENDMAEPEREPLLNPNGSTHDQTHLEYQASARRKFLGSTTVVFFLIFVVVSIFGWHERKLPDDPVKAVDIILGRTGVIVRSIPSFCLPTMLT